MALTSRILDRIMSQKVLLHDKESDGEDDKREKGTLQAVTGHVGGVPCCSGVEQKMQSKVNPRK